MSVTSVSQIPSFAPTFSDSGGSIGSISSMDFLQLLITELVNQDPMDPMDNKALLEQISAIRNLEAMTALTESQQNMHLATSLGSASALIGRYVEGLDSYGESVSGEVESVVVDNGLVLLRTAGGDIPLENVQSVKEGADG